MARAPTPTGYFLVRIAYAVSPTAYEFVEIWLSGGAYVDKQGGRYATADNPGVPLAGVTFEVDDVALCRTADGEGGTKWELLAKVEVAASAWKSPPARAATAAALPACTYANGASGVGATLTGDSNGALAAQDGVTLAAGEDLLVKDEANPVHNGLYTLTQSGDAGTPFVLTRRPDADESDDLLGACVAACEGRTNADTVWLCTADATITVGSTGLSWVRVGGGVSGTGTDNHLPRWDGTSAIQDSGIVVDDSDNLTSAGEAQFGEKVVSYAVVGGVDQAAILSTAAGWTTINGPAVLLYAEAVGAVPAAGGQIVWQGRSHSIFAGEDAFSSSTRFYVRGTGFGICSSANTLTNGGSVTTGGLTFQGGLYVSGTFSGSSGTVTSVAFSASTGFTVTGSPIVGAGVITLTITAGINGLLKSNGAGSVAQATPGVDYLAPGSFSGTKTVKDGAGVTQTVTIVNGSIANWT